MDKVEQQREHFNSVADRYREARQHPNHLHLKSLIWSNFLKPHAELFDNKHDVLEAMCGFADGKHLLETHLNKKFNYSGFDYSDEVVQQLKECDSTIKVFHGDINVINLTEDFEIIIILGGLHHVPHIAKKSVARLSEALKPGGLFINLEPTSGNPIFTWVRDRIYKKNDLFDEETERAFSVNELCSFFEASGLKKIDAVYPGLLAYIMYYNPDAFPLLNVGGIRMVNTTFTFDRLFLRNFIGKALSFATLSLWQKPLN